MRKLLYRIVFGFTLGITLLMVGYIGVYYIAGEEAFASLITKLTDVTTFQNQLLVVGLSGIMIAFAVHLMAKTLEESKESPSRMIVSLVLWLLSFAISMLLIENIGAFDEAMVHMLTIIGVVLFAAYALFHCIQEAVDEFIINKKIKEKNS